MSLTILEGPDGGGKTTLAAALKALDPPGTTVIHHGSYAGQEGITELYMSSIQLAKSTKVVLDRSWLSERIYGDVYRNGMNRLGSAGETWLSMTASDFGAVVVLCLPSYQQCYTTFTSRIAGEMLDTTRQLQQVYGGYARQNWKHIPVIEYDYTLDTFQSLLKRMEKLR